MRIRSQAFIVGFVVLLASASAWLGTTPLIARQTTLDPSLYSGLRWRMLGPFRGGRVDAVSGVPGRPNEFYFGAVNGGVWKTIDAGRVWTPVFDWPAGRLDWRARGRAVAARTRSTSAAASPRCAIRSGYGNGDVQVDRRRQDVDAHRPRRHAAHRQGRRRSEESRTSCSSRRSDISTRRTPDRGVFRSQDGGRTWKKVLFKNDNVGAVDVAIDPTNSQVVYAALWNTRRPTWYTYQPTNGPGGGIYKSTDGGTTWTQLTQRPADANASAAAASRWRRAIRGGSTPSSTISCRRRAGRNAVSRHAAGPRRRARRGRRGAPTRHRRRAASIDPTMRARRGRSCPATTRCGDAAGTSRRSRSIRRTPTSSTCRTSSISRSKDGGKTWVPLRGSPGGDDYHQVVGLAGRSEHDDRRERSGHDHHAQRARRTIRAT